MITRAEKLKQRIMRRVYALYLFKLVSQSVPSRVVLLTLSLAGLFSSVSVGSVFQNMPKVSDVAATYNFYAAALSHAEVIVKVLVLLLTVSALFLARDIVVKLRTRLSSQILSHSAI